MELLCARVDLEECRATSTAGGQADASFYASAGMHLLYWTELLLSYAPQVMYTTFVGRVCSIALAHIAGI